MPTISPNLGSENVAPLGHTPLDGISIGFNYYQFTESGGPKQRQVIQSIAITWVNVMGRPLNLL